MVVFKRRLLLCASIATTLAQSFLQLKKIENEKQCISFQIRDTRPKKLYNSAAFENLSRKNVWIIINYKYKTWCSQVVHR